MVDRELEQRIRALSFAALLPGSIAYRDLSVRDAPNLRETIRFYIDSGDKVFRVKEFFMDWFYSGFPKSLMRSLVDLYITAETAETHNRIWYFGRNYRGRDSASMYLDGTTVEIECNESALPEEFGVIVADLEFYPELDPRFRSMGFSARSFLSGHDAGEWWEDRRIGSMKWIDLVSERRLEEAGQEFFPVSAGSALWEDGSSEGILILSEPYFRRTIWIDFVDSWTALEHSRYRFRKKKGLFDTFLDNRSLLCFRKPAGPAAIQGEIDGRTVTVAFSPGFGLEDILPFRDNLHGILEFAEDHVKP